MATKETEKSTETESRSRVLRGRVVSSAMQDTITVIVDRFVKHPKYKKFQKRSKKYLVHDAGNTATVGEVVSIKEVAPISKRKRFALVADTK